MVATRSARKRTSGEVNTTSNSHNNNIIHSEPSLQPQTKRQRASVADTTATLNKKARALKPVVANVKKQTSSRSAKAKSATATATATATTKPKTKSNVRQTKTTTSSNSNSSSSNNDEVLLQRRSQRKKLGEKVVGTAAAAATIVGAQPSAKSAAKNNINDHNVSSDTASSFVKRLRSKKTSRLSGNQNGSSDDIDARDRNDPASVTDYVQDMYEHFRNKEEVQRMYIGPDHDGKQTHINENMRCILVDWLIEVHYKFKLFPETLYLTVNILDRFLSETEEPISKRDLQLVGVTALLISSKYEEMYIPELRDLTYICDGAYTEAKILQMEENILKTLKYNVTVPTPHTFLVRFLKAAHADKLMSQIANFILDGTLCSLEHLTCLWRPSQLAAAAVLIARRAVGKLNWSPTLMKYALYDEEDVIRVARSVLKAKNKLDRNRELLALQKKYSKNKYGKVSHYKFASIEDPF